jgi:hypothetical protein
MGPSGWPPEWAPGWGSPCALLHGSWCGRRGTHRFPVQVGGWHPVSPVSLPGKERRWAEERRKPCLLRVYYVPEVCPLEHGSPQLATAILQKRGRRLRDGETRSRPHSNRHRDSNPGLPHVASSSLCSCESLWREVQPAVPTPLPAVDRPVWQEARAMALSYRSKSPKWFLYLQDKVTRSRATLQGRLQPGSVQCWPWL